MRPDHLFGNKSLAPLPPRGGTVEGIVQAKERVSLCEVLQPLLEEDVLLGLVRENHGDLSRVSLLTAFVNRADDLRHGRDSRPTSDHAYLLVAPALDFLLHLDVKVAVAEVLEVSFRSLHLDRVLSDREAVQVATHLAAGVHLDDELHVALLIVTASRRVGSHDHVVLLVVEHQRDVLPNRQPQDVVRRGQGEAKAPRVVAHDLLLHQRKGLIFLGVQRDRTLGARASHAH
mmetsp:Transcript_2990/g.12096  ORF Transcript_2990/g.12096 Transcript_2990/m.12096 type:complete len:231 (+) Transcript_2990:245-937(+)